jgi:hypothetical protein
MECIDKVIKSTVTEDIDDAVLDAIEDSIGEEALDEALLDNHSPGNEPCDMILDGITRIVKEDVMPY